MAKYKVGFSSVKIYDIQAADGLKDQATEKELKDDIRRDTFDFSQEDGTSTDIFSEMNDDPVYSFTEQGKSSFVFDFMDTSADMLYAFFGGTLVTNGDTSKTWSAPDAKPDVYKYVIITTKEGAIFEFARCKVTAKRNFQVRRNEIYQIALQFDVLSSEFALPPVKMTDPAP